MDMIHILEDELGIKAEVQFMGMQPGDVKKTVADIEYTKEKLSYEPITSIVEGIPKFIEWYIDYNNR